MVLWLRKLDLFKTDLKLSDINNPKQYDNYYEIDGNLYCRNYSGKGWKSNYTGNYNIEIKNMFGDDAHDTK